MEMCSEQFKGVVFYELYYVAHAPKWFSLFRNYTDSATCDHNPIWPNMCSSVLSPVFVVTRDFTLIVTFGENARLDFRTEYLLHVPRVLVSNYLVAENSGPLNYAVVLFSTLKRV